MRVCLVLALAFSPASPLRPTPARALTSLTRRTSALSSSPTCTSLGAACTSRSVICSARSVTGVQARTARSDYRRDLRRGSAALPGPVMTSPRSDAPARRSTSTWISRSVHAQLNAIPAFRPRNAAVRCRSSCSARTRLVQQQRKPASHQHGEPRVSSDLGVESTVLGVERDRSRHVVHDVANIDCFDLIVGLRGRWAASRSVAHPP